MARCCHQSHCNGPETSKVRQHAARLWSTRRSSEGVGDKTFSSGVGSHRKMGRHVMVQLPRQTRCLCEPGAMTNVVKSSRCLRVSFPAMWPLGLLGPWTGFVFRIVLDRTGSPDENVFVVWRIPSRSSGIHGRITTQRDRVSSARHVHGQQASRGIPPPCCRITGLPLARNRCWSIALKTHAKWPTANATIVKNAVIESSQHRRCSKLPPPDLLVSLTLTCKDQD